MTSSLPPPLAEVHWKGSREDLRALAEREDWSGLRGLEQLWPELDQRHGEALALDAPHAHPPEQFSFRQLRQGIEKAAAGFAALGVRPGDVVALFAENGPRWLVADQGLMRAGAADAVRGSGAPKEELLYILQDSGAVGLVLESASLLQRLNLPQEACERLRFVVVLEGDGSAEEAPLSYCSWEKLLESGASATLPPLPEGGPNRLATLLYTSGTTGQPKGVPLSHANLLHQLGTLGVAVAPHPGDQVLSVLPIWHAYERTAEYFLLASGCRQTYTTLKQLRKDLQLVRPQYLISVPRLWEAILSGFEDALAAMPPSRQRLLGAALSNSRRYALSSRIARNLTLTAEAPPTRLRAALEAAMRWLPHRLAGAVLWPKVRSQLVGGRLRTAISGGGALAIHVDSFFEAIGIELLVGYGLTETSPVLTCRRPWSNRRGSAGHPLPDTEVRVVNPQTGALVERGEPGLVLARGPQVMAGYHHKPEATAKVLDADGWFDTGDLGRLLEDGSLVLTGRAKDTIVLSSGENIEPGPLEEALVASELLEQVMVVGQDQRQLGALVVPKLEALASFAEREALPVPEPASPRDAELLAHPSLLRALTRECNRILAARAGSRLDERLCGVQIVAPFSLENGLLTQTLKQRRDRIVARDAASIEVIYQAR